MFGPEFLMDLLLRLPALLVALTFHEWAHAFASDRLGDPTPRNMGRLSLNPLHHLDPLGTLMLFIGPIGWAKPVPVNPSFWRNRHAEFWVSLAGVAMNLALAVVFGVFIRLGWALPATVGPALMTMLYYGVFLNVALLVFNLLPIYPLDGSHVMRELLPWRLKPEFDRFNRYGPFVLLGLVVLDRQLPRPLLSGLIGLIVRLILVPESVFGGLS